MNNLIKCDPGVCLTCKWHGTISGCNKKANRDRITTINCDYILKHGGSRLFITGQNGAKYHEADMCDRYEKKPTKSKRVKWLDATPLNIGGNANGSKRK